MVFIEYLNKMIKGSLLVRFMMALEVIYRHSRLRRFVDWWSLTWEHSIIVRVLLGKTRVEIYRHSFIYRLLLKIGSSFDRLFRLLSGYYLAAVESSYSVRAQKRLGGFSLRISPQLGIYLLAGYLLWDYFFKTYLPVMAGPWDELMFVVLVASFLFWLIAEDRGFGIRLTPLDMPLALFFCVTLFLMIVNSPQMYIAIDGARVILQHILWFFVAINLLRSPKVVKKTLKVMVLMTFLIALHGIYQYVIGVEIPSTWFDMNENVSAATRVFSIIGSPNILGSLLVMMSPIAFSFGLIEEDWQRKGFYWLATIVMMVCLVFTFSRGAWLAFAFAAGIYAWIKDKRLFIPLVIAVLVIMVAVPAVSDRMTYMFSAEYIDSSTRGGRIGRWYWAWRTIESNLWLGTGLGRFGGAAAMRHIPGSFYADNFYLKTLAEMGVIGFSAFAFLLYRSIIEVLKVMRLVKEKSSEHYNLIVGIFAAMAGILAHNMVENVFEVPSITAYYWLLVALVLSYRYTGLLGDGDALKLNTAEEQSSRVAPSCSSSQEMEVVCVSTTDWYPIPTRKQQVMSRLPKEYKILYVEPPVTLLSAFKDKGVAHKLSAFRKGLQPVKENIMVYCPPPVLPFGNLYSLINTINQWWLSFFIRKQQEKMGFRKPLVWTYMPGSLPLVERLEPEFLIYDCVDEHSEYQGLIRKSTVLRMERDLIRACDLFFVTAKGLFDSKKAYNKNTYLIPNGVDFKLFNSVTKDEVKVAAEIAEEDRPVIGFIGAIQEWIDLELIYKVAAYNPKWKVVLVGPKGGGVDTSTLEKMPNVVFTGRQKPEDLPRYIKAFDVCINPFRHTELTRNVSPLKFYEYLATGKPIVSVNMPAVKSFADCVLIAATHQEFIDKIEEALYQDSEEKMKARIAWAQEISWENKVAQMLVIIDKVKEFSVGQE